MSCFEALIIDFLSPSIAANSAIASPASPQQDTEYGYSINDGHDPKLGLNSIFKLLKVGTKTRDYAGHCGANAVSFMHDAKPLLWHNYGRNYNTFNSHLIQPQLSNGI
jgi:hypothetical protein